MSHIFISYSRKNSDCVYEVVDEMKQQDFPVWIDLESIPMSTEWMEEIETAIKTARVFMLFWSKEANESDYVSYERKIAKALSITNQIKIVVVMLDDTQIPFEHIQGHNMKSGCSAIAIKKFVNNLSLDWKKFSSVKKLKDQSHKALQDEYVSVFYKAENECKSYIVGKKDKILPKKPEHLIVALQFFKPTNFDMFGSVFNSLPVSNPWVLHITGPVKDDQYTLDNKNPAQWEKCREFVVKQIQDVGDQASTQLHFFTLTPNALLGGVTIPLYRFWHVHLYNFISRDNVYLPVIELPRS